MLGFLLFNAISCKYIIMSPKHIAIIPDGNRRWAQKRKMLPWDGHAKGVQKFREIMDRALLKQVPYITFWAASEDNLLKRPNEEVRFLVKLLYNEVENNLKEKLIKNKVRLRFVGVWEKILDDRKLAEKVHLLEKETEKFSDYHLTILFGYDGRSEMLSGIEHLVKNQKGISSASLAHSLWTKDLPEVDLVIRTGEEERNWAHWSAGFMMWQTANAEFYFSQTLWPDFSDEEFDSVLEKYELRRKKMGS